VLVLIENGCLGYESTCVLKDVNLAIEEPGLILVRGANGSGKSTLLKTIAGLLKPISGRVRVLGRNPFSPRFDRSLIGYVPQDPLHQFTEPSVYEEIRLQAVDDEHARWAVEKLGVAHLLEESPLTLSVGEMKRVLIAAAVARDPRILLVDEPSIGQDSKNLCRVLELLRILAERGKLVVVASHDVRLWRCLEFDAVVEISNGSVKYTRVRKVG